MESEFDIETGTNTETCLHALEARGFGGCKFVKENKKGKESNEKKRQETNGAEKKRK